MLQAPHSEGGDGEEPDVGQKRVGGEHLDIQGPSAEWVTLGHTV